MHFENRNKYLRLFMKEQIKDGEIMMLLLLNELRGGYMSDLFVEKVLNDTVYEILVKILAIIDTLDVHLELLDELR